MEKVDEVIGTIKSEEQIKNPCESISKEVSGRCCFDASIECGATAKLGNMQMCQTTSDWFIDKHS